MEYLYSSEEQAWSNAYLWRPVAGVLDELAPPPMHVFELGCGNGATSRMLAAKNYEVTGVDPSLSGIELAKRSENDRLHFAVGSTDDDLASQYGQFPVVLSLEVIEHCPSARQFMRVFTSLMAPGGIGIISTPYHGWLKNLAIVASGRFDRHFDPLWEGGHLKFFSIPKLRELFHEFGLTYTVHQAGRLPLLAKSTIAVVRRKA